MTFNIMGLDSKLVLTNSMNENIELTLTPVRVRDYNTFMGAVGILNLQNFEFHDILKESNSRDVVSQVLSGGDNGIINAILESIDKFQEVVIENDIGVYGALVLMKELDMFVPVMQEIKSHIDKALTMSFKEPDVFSKIDSLENFDICKKAIREYNGIPYEPQSPNPEIRRLDNMKRKMEEMKGNTITFEAMYTSIMVELGYEPSQVNNLTLYQFFKVFDRVSIMKSYDTNTLYATVNDKANVIPWYSELKDKKQKTITEEELKKAKRKRL